MSLVFTQLHKHATIIGTLLLLYAGAIACMIFSAPTTVWAKPSGFDDGWTPPRSLTHTQEFNGQFTSLGARYGFTNLSNHTLLPLSGWTIDMQGRMSMPMYLGDVSLAYRFDQLSSTHNERADIHSLGVALAIHPGFYFLLGNGWIWYTLASIYLDIGMGAQHSVWTDSVVEKPTQIQDTSFFWHWGVGVDIPLWNPDAGHTPWLNIAYKNQRSSIEHTSKNTRSTSMDTMFLGLSWRFNTLLF